MKELKRIEKIERIERIELKKLKLDTPKAKQHDNKENVVTFTVRNSRHSKQPESIVTLTEENLDYDRERLMLVDLVLLENVSSVYLATFNTSYQLVPFT